LVYIPLLLAILYQQSTERNRAIWLTQEFIKLEMEKPGKVYNDELLRIPGGLVLVEWNRAPDAAMNVLDSSKMRGPSRQMLNKTMPAGTNFKIGYCRCRVE
jgi:hypothetical protein